ncbi:Asp-tRNA(Asn)/Glu-tRNA(Gln) amidotransferase subunit GatB [bacterium]|nr:Asp-tRNA(Asn)/Glu-tRNA(Gln) amidotransferase subunit GatB [bacterium]
MENNKYDIIIGLEIHIQTKTKSKMFCTCPTGYFQKEPNTHVCPVCLGLPGALPVPNKRAIELCILMGLATHCTISNEIYFDRKHYFYPDLPKGYQISQYKNPICSNGLVKLSNTTVEIERIHQEEDVAKSTHHTEAGTNKEYSLIDYNKSGVPLIEIVTKPCIRSSSQAKEYATRIRQIARYLNISDADMEKGQMRCEPNISIQEKGKWKQEGREVVPIGNYKLNAKIEIKNIGSITAVEKSINYEVDRLIEEIEAGNNIKQQTRGWNANKGITEFQRSKETSDDYRYMAEPDIPVIKISKEDTDRISKELIELPDKKLDRYINTYQLSEYDANVLSANKDVAVLFDKLVVDIENELKDLPTSAKLASNCITGTIFAWINEKGISISSANLDIADLVAWNLALNSKEITKSKAEKLLRESLDNKKDLSKLLDDFRKQSSESATNLTDIVKDVILKNEKAVNDFKNGNKASMGFLIGQVMQITQGSADPNETKSILIKELE